MAKYKDFNHYLAVNGVGLANIGHLKTITLVLGDKSGGVDSGLRSYLMLTGQDLAKELRKDLKTMDASIGKAARKQLDLFKKAAKAFSSDYRRLTAQMRILDSTDGDA